MEKFGTWTPAIPLNRTPRAVALGVFDGVHVGHRAVISAACAVRHEQAVGPFLTACVLSLVGVPKTDARLTADEDERDLCETLGVDEWLALPFDCVKEMSPETFVREILHERLQARVLCCGYNYRFGKNGAGDAAMLKKLCEPLDIRVVVIPPVVVNGQAVSATRIRSALEQGDVQTASRLLGRPFTIRRPVTRGNRVGHTLGFPTVNQVFEDGMALPRFGVYASLAIVDDKQHFAVTNVGVHPTVGGTDRPQAETWIADFDGDLYGTCPRVQLIRFLREEQRFGSVEKLRTQIDRDRTQALTYLHGDPEGGIRAVLFDFDDTLQDRPLAFLGAARELLQRYQPYLTEAQRKERAHIMLEENKGGYVHYATYFTSLFARWNWEGITAEALNDEYQRCFPSHTTLFPHARQTLEELKRRGYRVGIITNGSRLIQNRKVDVCGLRPLLDDVVVSGDEGVHKPDPELFRRAAARLGLAPQQCLFVGDHPVNDIQGALSAGMQAIFLDAGHLPVTDANVPVIRAPEELLKQI